MADPSRLTDQRGRVAVVTGGANGIGAACAALLAAAGARVVVFDREPPPAPAGVEAIALDVTDEASVDAAMGAVAARHGRLDVLVASAGIAIRRPATELPLSDWQKVVDVNLTGVFLCARAAARHMIAGREGGSIVAVASILGVVGGGVYPNVSYQAAKGGVINLTRALALEWAPHGIRVNAVAPTYTRTRLVAGLVADADVLRQIDARTPLGRLAEPEEVADAVLFLAGRGAAMVTGHVLAVDGGYLAQ